MRGGDKLLFATVALAVTGCTADDGKLNVRAIADPLTAAAKRGSPMLVEGRAALALGNVGTALEAFRKALREQPDNIEALAGIAACYERMGRYDLSRVNYEAALAIAPNNPILLNSFAASLQQQGRHAEAIALRAEARQAEAAEVASAVRMAQADIAAATPPAPPAVAATTVSPPPVRVAALAPPVVLEAPPARAVHRAPRLEPQTQSATVHTELVGNTEWTIEIPQGAQPPSSVSVALPPIQPIELAQIALAAEPRPAAPIAPVAEAWPAAPIAPAHVAALPPAIPAPEAAPVAIAAREQSEPKAPPTPAPKREKSPAAVVLAEPRLERAQPRLQRLSMGEVALLTRNEPAWRTEVVARTQHSVTARFVPLKGANAAKDGPRFIPIRTAMAASRPNVRLLNAARRQGLAARTRVTLLDRGWRKIAIGDAAQVRARSIVLYPANRQALGKRVAAQFGFASAINRQSNEVLVLLGRDAASLSFRRAGS